MFKVGDIVYTPEYPDTKYMKEHGIDRWHRNFFGKVTEVTTYPDGEVVIDVDFGSNYEWSYSKDELRLASDLKNMTLEEISNKFRLMISGVYLLYESSSDKGYQYEN